MSAEAARDYLDEAIWTTPRPLPGDLPAVPAFEPELLPATFRPWICDIAERMQCPADYPAVAALVVLASIVGRQLAIRPKRQDDWTVVPNLWGAIIGRPGVLKTPALQEPIRMIVRLESRARQEFETAAIEHAAAEMIAKAAAKQTEREIAAAMKRGDSQAANELALAAQARDNEPPVRRRYMTSDATVEKLGELLNENPNGVLLFRDELTGFMSSLDREGREGSRQFFLEAANGDSPFTFDRIGRGTVEVEAACVSVLGGIQPGPLAEYLRGATRGGAGDDGLMQRLQLMVWPDVSREFVNVDRWPDTEARNAAWQTYQRLDAIYAPSHGATDPGDGGIPFVRFDDAAQERFDDWRAGLELRLRAGDLAPAVESHLAKYRSLVPSLALLFHLVDEGTGGVGERCIVRALAWAEYLEQHAHRIYATAVVPELAAAKELAKHLVRGDLKDGFTARDVYLKGWRGLDVETTRKALAVLEDAGWIRVRPIVTGGRPKSEYDINPRAFR